MLGPLQRPKMPPRPRKLEDEQLNALSEAAHEAAVTRWQQDYLAPYEERHAVHERQKEELRRAQRAERDAGRSRSGHKKNAVERAEDQRRRSRENYHRMVKAAHAKGTTIMCGWGQLRRSEEERLLGASFVEAGQRVRIVGVPELEGQCGTVVERAQLCEESPNRIIVRWPKLNSAGGLDITDLGEPQERHHVRIDGRAGEPVTLWPANVVPWPQAGQLVRGASAPAEDFPNDIATVVCFTGSVRTGQEGGSKFSPDRSCAFWAAVAEQAPSAVSDHTAKGLKCYEAFLSDTSATANEQFSSIYLCSQSFLAWRSEVEPVTPSDTVSVGMLVRLLPPHPWHFMQADLSQFELNSLDLICKWGDVSPGYHHALFVVKDVCAVCGDSIELERLFCTPHFLPGDANDEGDAPTVFQPLTVPIPVPPRFTALRCDHFHDDLSSDSLGSYATDSGSEDDDASDDEHAQCGDNDGVLV